MTCAAQSHLNSWDALLCLYMCTSAACHANAGCITPPPSTPHTLICISSLQDVCENVKSSQSHNVHRIVEFEPIGPAALSLRIFMTYCAVRGSQQARAGWQHELLRLAGCLLLWVAISVLKAALGFLLKYLATLYTHHYQHAFQKSGRNPRINLSTKQT